MAYLPSPIKHDLFLSYAHEDELWVRALRKRLKERLLDSLGECEIWQDKSDLTTGQNWHDALTTAIQTSAAFIAVISRNYQNSKPCEAELKVFLTETGQANRLESGGYGRVLKVIKFPWLHDTHEGFLREYQHILFFDRDPETREIRHFKPTSETFRRAVNKLGFHIETLFEAMLRGMVKVFVARASASGVVEKRASMIRELRAAGYALSPPPAGAIPDELATKSFTPFIGEADVTVHLLGAMGDSDTREQIALSLEAGKKAIFCLLPGCELAQNQHKDLLKDIRENRWNLPQGSWALLESRSIATLNQDLIELLKPSRTKSSIEARGTQRVYLVCDPTSSDLMFAEEVRDALRDEEHFEVELSQAPKESSSPSAHHERLLRWCDGLLLYHDQAPSRWYSRNVADLLTAEDRADRRELKSKALLATATDAAIPGVMVIQRRDPFKLGQLEPFLAPLRAPSNQPQFPAGQAGTSNVDG